MKQCINRKDYELIKRFEIALNKFHKPLVPNLYKYRMLKQASKIGIVEEKLFLKIIQQFLIKGNKLINIHCPEFVNN